MTNTADLERGYRRWLRWYPKSFRREHEAETLAGLLAGARAGQRRPAPMEYLDLVRSALWMRLCPRVPRSNRAVFAAVKLMCVGAVAELRLAVGRQSDHPGELAAWDAEGCPDTATHPVGARAG